MRLKYMRKGYLSEDLNTPIAQIEFKEPGEEDIALQMFQELRNRGWEVDDDCDREEGWNEALIPIADVASFEDLRKDYIEIKRSIKGSTTMRKRYIKSADELTPFVARVVFDYGSAEYGQDYSWHEELVWANSAREARDMIDNKYSYRKTGQPYDGCFIQYASQEDVDRLSHYSCEDCEDLPFSSTKIGGCSITSSETVLDEIVIDNVSISQDAIQECEGVLIDNGVDPEFAKDVLQAIGYILLDTELYSEEE